MVVAMRKENDQDWSKSTITSLPEITVVFIWVKVVDKSPQSRALNNTPYTESGDKPLLMILHTTRCIVYMLLYQNDLA